VETDASISRQRIVSLWLKRLSTDRIVRHGRGDGFRPPLVVAGRQRNVDQLVAVDAAAERLGLVPGLTRAQARAMHPDLAVVAEDPAADQQLLAELSDWCVRYTPLVAVDPPDGILLDISGCAHLFGGEENLVHNLSSRIANFGFTLRAAVASTIGAASAAARFTAATIVPGGAEREFLTNLPIAALRLPADTVAALARVGLKRIGDMLDLPRAPLAARFGPSFLRQLDRALGREDEPLSPRLPVAPYVAEQRFAEPIARSNDVLGTLARLAARLKPMLERRGEGARALELTLFRTDGAVRRIAVATSRPLREPDAIRALFVERLASLADALDPGFGFDLTRLSVSQAEPCPPEQIGLDGDDHAADIDRLIDRLSARLGSRRVRRPIARHSHIPELAAALVPAQVVAGEVVAGEVIADEAIAGGKTGWAEFCHFARTAGLSPRPPRLLIRPEPIEAIAAVPDGPPVRFRWRRALHEIVSAQGPERIETEWWSEDGGPARDYFRVEDKAGCRFWLFRAGLYRLTATPTWFLHGMFA
jgi:protein ImuB